MRNPFKKYYDKYKNWMLLRKLQKTAEPPTAKKLIYTDKNGNKYHTLKNPTNLPAQRALVAWVFLDDMKYGITRERLQYGMDKIKDCMNRQQPDLNTIGQVIGALEASMSLYAEPKILLNFCSVYVTMNGEQFDEWADYEQLAKSQAWDKDPEAKGFFLQYAHNLSRTFIEREELNVPDYLKKVKPILDQISWNLDPTTKESSS